MIKNLGKFIKKHKILTIIFIIIVGVFATIIFLFNKNSEMFNFKTITYKRTSVCGGIEFVDENLYEKDLSEILGTKKYSYKNFVVNNSNVSSISFKSYKNKPAKQGDAVITLKRCANNKIYEWNGRYEYIDDYIVVFLERDVFIFYYDKKEKVLIDYNNYVQDGKEKYILD